jgi:hypothetical protein
MPEFAAGICSGAACATACSTADVVARTTPMRALTAAGGRALMMQASGRVRRMARSTPPLRNNAGPARLSSA